MLLPSSSLSAAFRGLSLHSATPAKRSFSTSVCLQSRKKLPEAVPPYPYKPNYVYKQADTGLYGGVTIQFGNKISKGRNKGKTRRSWKPNVRWKKIHSDALDKDLFLKVTRRALRTIEKSKGLDNYLLSDKPARIKELGLTGWELRWKVMQTPSIQEKFRQQRKALGLPEAPPTFEEWVKEKEEKRKGRTLDEDTAFKSSFDIKSQVQPKRPASPKVKSTEKSK